MSLSILAETTEKLWLLDVFGEYRKRPVARNALRIPQILCCLLSPKGATIFVLILSNLMLNCHKIPLSVKSMFKNFVYIWMNTFIFCSQTFFPDLRLRYLLFKKCSICLLNLINKLHCMSFLITILIRQMLMNLHTCGKETFDV